jgi:hypothetical protein
MEHAASQIQESSCYKNTRIGAKQSACETAAGQVTDHVSGARPRRVGLLADLRHTPHMAGFAENPLLCLVCEDNGTLRCPASVRRSE